MGVGGQPHAPAVLPPGKSRYPLYRMPVWTGADNLAPTGIRSPDRPACSESLYLLSYPGPPLINQGQIKFTECVILVSSESVVKGKGKVISITGLCGLEGG